MARTRMHDIPVTYEDVRALFDYSPIDGRLVWKSKVSQFSRSRMGSAAGTISGSYRMVRVAGVGLYEHRLVWMWHHGEWPAGEVDHINGNGLDNRIENIRVVDRATNQQNTGPFKNNTTGVKGVVWIAARKKFRATIRSGKSQTTLGYFDCKEAASSAYRNARASLHPGYRRDGAEVPA